ncbi:hypothetical protein C8R46DRAFT_885098, partial [Mycena filopes]
EEMLIDFRELVGEHSGANMADAVWDTFEKYGLEDGKVPAMMDNATNNDGLMAGLESKFQARGITWFDALEARMRCFPHTTHLAVLKVRSFVICPGRLYS